MRAFAKCMLAAGVLVAAPVARADEVPKLNVAVSCHASAQADGGDRTNGNNEQACLADENAARDTLAKQWSQYPAASRARCTRMINDVPGTQSYIELLSCLEMDKESKQPQGTK